MKMGRPKLSANEKKGQITGVRLRSEERELLERAALGQKQKLSEWMRETLLSRASKEARA
jgi:uncharacterized protein (DUF1778 family)